MNDDCKRMKDKMADHLFDGLSVQDQEVLNEHVAKCSNCAGLFQTLKDERDLLKKFAEKVDSTSHERKERLAEAIRNYDLNGNNGFESGWKTAMLSPFTKFSAAAVLLIAAGFFAGRLVPSPPIDVEQLRITLESSMKSSLEEAIHKSLIEKVRQDRETALDLHYTKLKNELARQFRQEMNDLALRTLAASDALTDRRLEQLIRLIEAARAVDHRQIARALHYIESNRLEDRNLLGQSLESLDAIRDHDIPVAPKTN